MPPTDVQQVEQVLRTEFTEVEAYRFNVASIRVKVVDARFCGLSHSKRVDKLEPLLDTLPEEIQRDITNLYLFTPDEVAYGVRGALQHEFEHGKSEATQGTCRA